jgi:hypothetical protein
LWRCADGREVLFNRRYKPLWQRLPGCAAAPADPAEPVSFVAQSWFVPDMRAHHLGYRRARAVQGEQPRDGEPPVPRAAAAAYVKHVDASRNRHCATRFLLFSAPGGYPRCVWK